VSQTYPGMLSLIKADLARKSAWYHGADAPPRLWRMALSDGSLTSILHRFTERFLRWRLAPLAWLFYSLNSFLSGAVIGLGATIGPGFTVVHSQGLIINAGVVIGRDGVVGAGVVIGAAWDGPSSQAFPVLGDGVFVGAGAKILGGVTVGDGARIGANAVVIGDVPDGALAVGVPARVRPAGDQG